MATATSSILTHHPILPSKEVTDFEPSLEWKEALKARIGEGLQAMRDDALKVMNDKLKQGPISAEGRLVLEDEYKDAMQFIKKIASEQFHYEVEKERESRRWAAGQAMRPGWGEDLVKEQQSILETIQKQETNEESSEEPSDDSEELDEDEESSLSPTSQGHPHVASPQRSRPSLSRSSSASYTYATHGIPRMATAGPSAADRPPAVQRTGPVPLKEAEKMEPPIPVTDRWASAGPSADPPSRRPSTTDRETLARRSPLVDREASPLNLGPLPKPPPTMWMPSMTPDEASPTKQVNNVRRNSNASIRSIGSIHNYRPSPTTSIPERSVSNVEADSRPYTGAQETARQEYTNEQLDSDIWPTMVTERSEPVYARRTSRSPVSNEGYDRRVSESGRGSSEERRYTRPSHAPPLADPRSRPTSSVSRPMSREDQHWSRNAEYDNEREWVSSPHSTAEGPLVNWNADVQPRSIHSGNLSHNATYPPPSYLHDPQVSPQIRGWQGPSRSPEHTRLVPLPEREKLRVYSDSPSDVPTYDAQSASYIPRALHRQPSFNIPEGYDRRNNASVRDPYFVDDRDDQFSRPYAYGTPSVPIAVPKSRVSQHNSYGGGLYSSPSRSPEMRFEASATGISERPRHPSQTLRSPLSKQSLKYGGIPPGGGRSYEDDLELHYEYPHYDYSPADEGHHVRKPNEEAKLREVEDTRRREEAMRQQAEEFRQKEEELKKREAEIIRREIEAKLKEELRAKEEDIRRREEELRRKEREAEERAKKEAEEMAKKEAEYRAKKEAEENAREAREQARKEAEQKAEKEEQKFREEMQATAKKEAEEIARVEKEGKESSLRRRGLGVEGKARKGAEERKKAGAEQRRQETEGQANIAENDLPSVYGSERELDQSKPFIVDDPIHRDNEQHVLFQGGATAAVRSSGDSIGGHGEELHREGKLKVEESEKNYHPPNPDKTNKKQRKKKMEAEEKRRREESAKKAEEESFDRQKAEEERVKAERIKQEEGREQMERRMQEAEEVERMEVGARRREAAEREREKRELLENQRREKDEKDKERLARKRVQEEEMQRKEAQFRKEQEEMEERERQRRKQQEQAQKLEEDRKLENETARARKEDEARRAQEQIDEDYARKLEEEEKRRAEDLYRQEDELRRRAEQRKRQNSGSTASHASWTSTTQRPASTTSTWSDHLNTTSSTWSTNSSAWAPRKPTTPSTTSTTSTTSISHQSTSPPSEAEWQRRHAEQAKKQQEAFRKEQEKLERQRQQKAGTLMSKDEIHRIFESHNTQRTRLRSLDVVDWDDFPWPMLKPPATPEEITSFGISAYILNPYYPDHSKPEKDRLKEHIRYWHPDRFETKLLPKVVDNQREKVKTGAGFVVRCLNDLLTRLNTES